MPFTAPGCTGCIFPFCVLKLCCMKVEVDMEKISAEIAAAEEAARKRMAEREKDAGDRGAREAPTCVLAEEDKHICATHGSKSQQTPLIDSNSKQGENAEPNSADVPGEPGPGLLLFPLLSKRHLTFDPLVYLIQGRSSPQRSWKFILAARRGRRRTKRASQRASWRRGPVTVTRARRPPPHRRRTRLPTSRPRGRARPEQPTEIRNYLRGSQIIPGESHVAQNHLSLWKNT